LNNLPITTTIRNEKSVSDSVASLHDCFLAEIESEGSQVSISTNQIVRKVFEWTGQMRTTIMKILIALWSLSSHFLSARVE